MLYISVRTAETHRAHIMQKLRLSSRAELVRYALAEGLLEGLTDSLAELESRVTVPLKYGNRPSGTVPVDPGSGSGCGRRRPRRSR